MTKEEIISVLAELYKITGFRVSLHGADYSEIAAYPAEKREFCRMVHKSPDEYEKCVACDKAACKKALNDKNTHIYTCRYGFTEAVSPLYNFVTLTGFLMMGQVRVDGDGTDTMLLTLARMGKRDFEAREITAAIPSVREDMIRSYVKIMTICASYLTLSNAVTGSKATVGQLAMQYITENYTDKIGVKDICDAIGYSKSTVLAAFKREFATTVNSYLTNIRLERARKMLENEDTTINEVALASGFSDQSYFSKVFSAKYKITPTEYRKDEKR